MVEVCSVADLLLDERNPRFPPEGVKSQREAVNALLAGSGAGKMLALAQDIATEGVLNPTELPVIVIEDGERVVIEGNRRLAVLKLLRNPDLANEATLAARFRRLQDRGIGPASVTCYLAESREDAKHWLELRHTGENGGVGVVEWDAEQQNNFRRRRGTQVDRAAMICDAIKTDFPDEVDLLADVATVRRTKPTTLGRLFGDPVARKDFGISLDGGEVGFEFASQKMLPALRRLFSDLAGKVTVADFMNKELRQQYLDRISGDLPPRESRLKAPRNPGEAAPNESEASSTESADEPTAPNPATTDEIQPTGQPDDTTSDESDAVASTPPPPGAGAPEEEIAPPSNATEPEEDEPETDTPQPAIRRTQAREERVIFKGLKLKGFDLRTSKVLSQSQTVDVEDAPAVAGAMLRIVIECAATEYLVAHTLGVDSERLQKKIRKVLVHLDPDIESSTKRDKVLEPAWLQTQGSTGLGIQTMHAFVHSFTTNPAPSEVRHLSMALRPMLERMDSAMPAPSAP